MCNITFLYSGVPLLPLADNKLTKFVNHGEAVYIPTKDISRELFPGLESHLIADDLDDLLRYRLAKMADEGNYPHLTLTISCVLI